MEHDGSVSDAVFTPDGKALVSLSGQVTSWAISYADMPVDVAEKLAELLASARIDESGRRVSLGARTEGDWTQGRDALMKGNSRTFFFRLQSRPNACCCPEYIAAVNAKIAATKTATEREALLAWLLSCSHAELGSENYLESIFLCEKVLKLDPTSLGAKSDLGQDYLNLDRAGDALPIYVENAGRRFKYWKASQDEVIFGAGALDDIKYLRENGKDNPTLAKIEAVIGPTTRPAATQPAATEPTTQPAP